MLHAQQLPGLRPCSHLPLQAYQGCAVVPNEPHQSVRCMLQTRQQPGSAPQHTLVIEGGRRPQLQHARAHQPLSCSCRPNSSQACTTAQSCLCRVLCGTVRCYHLVMSGHMDSPEMGTS